MHQAPYPYPATLIFGIPGAGKGTQGDILKSIPGFFHVSSGNVFRQMGDATEEARMVRECIRAGELVPDELTIRVFLEHLEAKRHSGEFKPERDLLLLDGIPRAAVQCHLLRPYIDVKLILHLVCHDEDGMIQRIRRRAKLENRPDDYSVEVIRKRFAIYQRQTLPVLQEYPPSVIAEIDSNQTQAEVLLACLSALVPVFKANFPRKLPAGG
ncbi:MAG: nucleoside monophosphate kinase [Planctomycetaceae bacterium]|nr:nucleoside monophosphate kinase [Planctomycetaceae bacterium]